MKKLNIALLALQRSDCRLWTSAKKKLNRLVWILSVVADSIAKDKPFWTALPRQLWLPTPFAPVEGE